VTRPGKEGRNGEKFLFHKYKKREAFCLPDSSPTLLYPGQMWVGDQAGQRREECVKNSFFTNTKQRSVLLAPLCTKIHLKNSKDFWDREGLG